MAAIGYVRQSKRADLDVALSRDAQLAAIRRLCGDCEILEDMGRSGGRGKEHLRPGYQQVLAGMASGQYTEVYAIALSRFSRSVPELHDFMELALAHEVRITTAKEGTLDPTTAVGKAMFNMNAMFAEFVRDTAVESARENVAERRARGERMGRVPYGEAHGDDVGAVVAAFRKAGSLNGAALALNRPGGLRSRLGRDWTGTAVRNVIARREPALLPLRAARGVKPSSPFALYRLLRCPCGSSMTASHSRSTVVYRCHAADAKNSHVRPYRVREAVVLPWVMAEIGRLRLPETVEMAGDEAERDRLTGKRDGIGDAYAAGAYGPVGSQPAKAKLAERLAEIDAAMDDLDTRSRALTVPSVDWDWPPAILNGALRKLIAYVQLDETMRPVNAERLLPPEYWA